MNPERGGRDNQRPNEVRNFMIDFKKIIFEIQRIAKQLKVKHCYIYGGTVRDLLRRNISRDISIIVEREHFKNIIKLLSQKFKNKKGHSIKSILGLGSRLFKTSIFGIFVRIREISRRTDTSSVRSLLEDEHRNCDFTVNSMFIDLLTLNPASFETGFDFHDFCGAMRDLEAGILKCTDSVERTFDRKFARFMRLIRISEENGFKIDKRIVNYILEQRYHSKWSYFDLIKHDHEFNRVISSDYFADIIDAFFKLQLNMLVDERYNQNAHTFIVSKLKHMPLFDSRDRDEEIFMRQDYFWDVLVEATNKRMNVDCDRWRPIVFGIHN